MLRVDLQTPVVLLRWFYEKAHSIQQVCPFWFSGKGVIHDLYKSPSVPPVNTRRALTSLNPSTRGRKRKKTEREKCLPCPASRFAPTPPSASGWVSAALNKFRKPLYCCEDKTGNIKGEYHWFPVLSAFLAQLFIVATSTCVTIEEIFLSHSCFLVAAPYAVEPTSYFLVREIWTDLKF